MPIREGLCLCAMLAGCAALAFAPAAAREPEGARLKRLERSYWLHASLGSDTRKNYWGPDFPDAQAPTRAQVENAARLLTGPYAANRLYLIYNREIPLDAAREVFGWWRAACPKEVEIVPTLVLRMYDTPTTPVFAVSDLRAFAGFLKERINPRRLAVYDVYPNRDQGEALSTLAGLFPKGLVRVGLQPGETLPPQFAGAVEDTWSGLCTGKTHADWRAPGAGAETLRRWVGERNAPAPEKPARPVAWDLVAVAWDYAPTPHGEFPGYDDADKNMPLPEGRNQLAARLILDGADPAALAGFSSDLFILHVNARSARRDGPDGAFYEALKRGKPYEGYFAAPLNEIAAIYRDLRAGRLPAENGS